MRIRVKSKQTAQAITQRYLSGRFVCLFLLLATVGCSKFDLRENIPWKPSSDEPRIPGRITALWTHTILEQPGRRGIRGFGGRMMFHDREGEKPVIVEGDLVVYAFDDTDGPMSHPEKKFVFTSTDLSSHHSVSRLGHSYSFWLPWDEVGGPPRKISLVVRFSPKGAGSVMSESTHVMLPGIDPAIKQEIQEAAARFRERQKQEKAIADASAQSVAPIATTPMSTTAEQSGVSQVSGRVDETQGRARVVQQTNGLDVITIDASPNLGTMMQNAPVQNSAVQQNPFEETPAQVPVSPPPSAVSPGTGAPAGATTNQTSAVKGSLSERAAARRPTRFLRTLRPARVATDPLTAPDRGDQSPGQSGEPSDLTGKLSPRQISPQNQAAALSDSTTRN